jgi:hypothetical protein
LCKGLETPGTYGLIQGDRATVWVALRKRW